VALRGPSHTTNPKNSPNKFKHLINDHVEMSEKSPPKKARVARGNSDGKYLGAHGPTNKFQAEWLEHPAPAAMSLITSQKQHSPPPGPFLSQRVLGGSHALKGAG